MDKAINVIVADDSKLIRDGLVSVLSRVSNISVVSAAENGKELLKLLDFLNPDIVLLDIKMPIMDGLQALKIIVKKYPKIKAIMISMYFEKALIEKMSEMGAWGFIPKGCDDVLIEETILAVNGGSKRFNTEIPYDLVTKELNKKEHEFDNPDNLSLRELEILGLICQCKPNKQMADILRVTVRTIEFHKTNIYKKTRCVSTSDLVLYSLKRGIFAIK